MSSQHSFAVTSAPERAARVTLRHPSDRRDDYRCRAHTTTKAGAVAICGSVTGHYPATSHHAIDPDNEYDPRDPGRAPKLFVWDDPVPEPPPLVVPPCCDVPDVHDERCRACGRSLVDVRTIAELEAKIVSLNAEWGRAFETLKSAH